MKKAISALIVVIMVAIGAVYFASNEVEKNYQRIVNDLRALKFLITITKKVFLAQKDHLILVFQKIFWKIYLVKM